ncbi:MAG: metal-dependent transcriptional regulator [Oscillospiraceae bacterium]|jgi:Mn-dependent DtxR family transcriptional regulator|nr:metal-dependent transcriptional regulator [Oscillospiraceae bacterium]
MKLYETPMRASAEDYLETILLLSRRRGMVRAIDVATEMNFSKPSVSVAMKKLRMQSLIEVDEDGNITLTPDGSAEAERVLERHATLNDWLCRIGVPEEIAQTDACRLEHILSAETYDAIKRYAARTQLHQPQADGSI